MNVDILSCKWEAVTLTQSNQPPLDGNGKRKGYIRTMKELWDAKGYESLGLSSQNLRDQAAKLEKLLEQSHESEVANSSISNEAQARVNMGDSITRSANNDLYNLEEIVNDLPQYANLPTTTNQNLHTSSTAQIPGDTDQTEREKGDNGAFGLPSRI